MSRLWRRLKLWWLEKVLGRKYFMGCDPSSKDGAYGAVIFGYRGRDGIIYITDCKITKPKEAK